MSRIHKLMLGIRLDAGLFSEADMTNLRSILRQAIIERSCPKDFSITHSEDEACPYACYGMTQKEREADLFCGTSRQNICEKCWGRKVIK